ncbi:hypothetical protein FHW83_003693 [Duganella sp. SG902]|uniref:hypothetical protein n=1 Tax=Duganella sp. SG902 TaxID=2587016 RepID=UPI00159E0475|nr:hypothetical protein [Duganella sp. SG902]NVM77870.1 hypothetical protein [Duganella sp. SG902]
MENELDALLAAYSTGKVSRRELERATGLWFGEILAEMAARRLPLPRVDTRVHFNDAQRRLFERVFG